MNLVLGVDAGNTKTVALAARLDGTIVGAGRAGCGDIYDCFHAYAGHPDGPVDGALRAVADAVIAALGQADAHAYDVMAGGFSMAGADWPEDIALLHSALSSGGWGRDIVVVNDAVGPLLAGAPGGFGVSVVCGTGAAIAARARDGRLWHTSHWQESHGAEELGRLALRAVYRAELGIDPPTRLTGRVMALFDRPCVEDVLHLFTARGVAPPRDLGRVARLLFDEAEQGDATARNVVERHGASLGDYALAAARRVSIEATPFTLVLAGGVFRRPASLLADALVARVRRSSPDVIVAYAQMEPAVGALMLAYEAARIRLTPAMRARLLATAPPPAFFAT